MLKLLPLAGALLCVITSIAQKTDTLLIFYPSDQFRLSTFEQKRLENFLHRGWDRILINGYTDEADTEEYNLDLSRKRSGVVYDFFVSKKMPAASMMVQSFGETLPKASNDSEDGRSLNRRTEIIGYQFPRIKPKPVVDPMKPVTKTLDNGMIITYRPGALPDDMYANFESGSGMNFQVISNTYEMRRNSLFNNTTNGEILSSVLIICGTQGSPCKLDSPVLVQIPIPADVNCPIEKVKFFNAVAENGKRIWQEQNKLFYPEMIGDRRYIRIWLDNFCECINFDFKIDPDCYDVDSTKLLYVNADVRNLTTELKGMNSVYMPKRSGDGSYNILYIKKQLRNAVLTFSLFDGKRRIRGFRDQQLSSLPFDETAGSYVITTGSIKLGFSRVNVNEVTIKVNGERYRVAPEGDWYEFKYLRRNSEKILVDLSVIDGRGRIHYLRNQPIDRIPSDGQGNYIIDKKFLKERKEAGILSRI